MPCPSIRTQTPCHTTKTLLTRRTMRRKHLANLSRIGKLNRVKILKMHTRWKGMAPPGAAATTMRTRTLLDNMPNNFGATRSKVVIRSNQTNNRKRKLLSRLNRVIRSLSLRLSHSLSNSHSLSPSSSHLLPLLVLLKLLLPLLRRLQLLLPRVHQLLPRSKLINNHSSRSSRRPIHLLRNQLPHLLRNRRRPASTKVIRRASTTRSIENIITKSTTSTITSTTTDKKNKKKKPLRLLRLPLKNDSVLPDNYWQ